jgi:hypothetical protein
VGRLVSDFQLWAGQIPASRQQCDRRHSLGPFE